MQYIRYNRKAIGKPEIFAGGGNLGEVTLKEDNINEDKVFYDDIEDEKNNAANSTENGINQGKQGDESTEVDPLEAYMQEVNINNQSTDDTIERKDVEIMEEEEVDYQKLVEREKEDVVEADDYDEDGNPVKMKEDDVNLITSVTREEEYAPLQKDFYHQDMEEETEELYQWKRENQIAINNLEFQNTPANQALKTPNPALSFEAMQFPSKLLFLIQHSHLTTPTPIQSASIPLAVAGRDIIGSSPTGSGKTYSYLWPLLIHITNQNYEKHDRKGPYGIILVPTRELAEQIYMISKAFFTAFNLQLQCITGGYGEWQQKKALYKSTIDVLVGTPGRVIDMVNQKYIILSNCSYVVLDEADRMISMGFERQIRSLLSVIRPDRQLLLFSATFPSRIVKLALELMNQPVRVSVGRTGLANVNIRQELVVLDSSRQKDMWIKQHISEAEKRGKILLFVSTKQAVDSLVGMIRGITTSSVEGLHGDKPQYERSKIMNDFKNNTISILIATDVAARGLDVKDIQTVINYDVPYNTDAYVHRIGRTCRYSQTKQTGIAITLFSPNDKRFASQLIRYFNSNSQSVPSSLLSLVSGVVEKVPRGSQTQGIGYDDNRVRYNRRDAFNRYFKRTFPAPPASSSIPVKTHENTPLQQRQYKTVYDAVTNTYTTVPIQQQATITTASLPTINGFVAGQDRSLSDALPVSAYGTADDEWDSSKMAMESVLAVLHERQEERKKEKERRYGIIDRYEQERRSHSKASKSRNRKSSSSDSSHHNRRRHSRRSRSRSSHHHHSSHSGHRH